MRMLASSLAVALLLTALVGPAAAQTEAAAVLPSLGSKFPDISLPGVAGRQIRLSDFPKKALLLSFWSCHTDTCFTSVRVIEGLLAEYSSRGLVAPTVCAEVPPTLEKDDYRGLTQRCGAGQIIMIDKDMALTKSLGIVEFPTTFLIDRNRAVWQIITGVRPLMEDDFRDLVKSLLSE